MFHPGGAGRIFIGTWLILLRCRVYFTWPPRPVCGFGCVHGGIGNFKWLGVGDGLIPGIGVDGRSLILLVALGRVSPVDV